MNNLAAFLQTIWAFFCIGLFATLNYQAKSLDEPLQTITETAINIGGICIWLLVAYMIDQTFNKDK